MAKSRKASIIKKIIQFSESGNFLIIMPIVQYGDIEIKIGKFSNTPSATKTIKRDINLETQFREFVVSKHPNFSTKTNHDYYFLKAEDVMKRFWFVNFCDACNKNDIEITGTENLKNLKYFPGKANTSYNFTSDIDWFNTKVNMSFGKEKISLKNIQKAVLKNNGHIKLTDGSIGVISPEWMNKWKLAFEFGTVKGDKLKLSKSQFIIMNSVLEDTDIEKVSEEFKTKLEGFKNFDKIDNLDIPTRLNATLRDYQHSGFNWLAFMSKFGFGGCLADDMGLGKTLQILCYLSYLKDELKSELPNLVVCPTTLMFNWEKEIEKFAPYLTVARHWGNTKLPDSEAWNKFDIVLISYGTLVSDIENIRNIQFGAIVLDEAQAIKNMNSLRFKAVSLLKSDYRFSVTGTPIENNLMELFAQMHFLNPGLLGSPNHFQKEYVAQIDKGLAPEKAEQLKRIVYPFMLRRTKEVVAKELPEKTEMILYCEMGEKQRAVYDKFVALYRNSILSKIDTDGISQAKFSILDALLKIRQICNSPSLLNTEEKYCADSVKTDELIRHIENKTANHKVLIFSQFVGMLKIVKDRLENDGIKYSYLDGQTRDREAVVNQFVDNNDVRVFLISLKAGGFGLNLTVADYVYLIDPWWNPAAEAQAIDRVHRIGQDKKVFAYKMICKDTIEEKIIKMQEKKKNLADEIITSEQSFVKNLDRNDIEELFY
jgi:SNF2 family DNA or RNA helicase